MRECVTAYLSCGCAERWGAAEGYYAAGCFGAERLVCCWMRWYIGAECAAGCVGAQRWCAAAAAAPQAAGRLGRFLERKGKRESSAEVGDAAGQLQIDRVLNACTEQGCTPPYEPATGTTEAAVTVKAAVACEVGRSGNSSRSSSPKKRGIEEFCLAAMNNSAVPKRIVASITAVCEEVLPQSAIALVQFLQHKFPGRYSEQETIYVYHQWSGLGDVLPPNGAPTSPKNYLSIT